MTRRRAAAAVCAVSALCASAAFGQGGGVFPSVAPAISSFGCASGCAGVAVARPGATITITGTNLSAANRVVFLGVLGTPTDDVVAPASPVGADELIAVVPAGAVTGHLRALNGDGNPSPPSHQVLRISDAAPTGTGAVETQLSAKTIYFDGTDPATLRYFVDGVAPSTVTVALVHGRSGSAVETWPPSELDVGDVGLVSWDGTSAAAKAVAGGGKYTFKLTVSGGGGARAAAAPVDSGTFTFLPDVFPVQGPHHFNLGDGRFGAQRAGHIHQGQDVMADCGTPLVAARGGTVMQNAVDVNAGNYLVIHTGADSDDMVYAHLRHPSPLKVGTAVKSGQSIGVVGETGDATACHLHFEEWTPPGWYKGGHPIDPLPDLRRWDSEAKLVAK